MNSKIGVSENIYIKLPVFRCQKMLNTHHFWSTAQAISLKGYMQQWIHTKCIYFTTFLWTLKIIPECGGITWYTRYNTTWHRSQVWPILD